MEELNIDKYIQWSEIWNEEICVKTSIDVCDNKEMKDLMKRFLKDKDIELMESECNVHGNYLMFFFGEQGGQNESDTQGWSRDYTFTVDKDFSIINVEYSQG